VISQPGGVPEESECEGNHTTIPLMVATVVRKSGRKRREEEKLQREEAPPNPNRRRPLLPKHPIGMTHERHLSILYSIQIKRPNIIERRDARNAAADGSEKAPKIGHRPTPPKQAKRTSDDLETGDRASKSRKKEAFGAAAKMGSIGRDKVKNPQKAFDSFTDLTEISQKVLEPDKVRLILIQQCDEKYHNKVVFLTRLFFAIVSPQAFRQLSEACSIVRQNRESMISYSVDDDSGLMSALRLVADDEPLLSPFLDEDRVDCGPVST
jgi:hypothetical protein